MIKIYDTSYSFVSVVDSYKDMCVKTVLETGTKSLSFKLPMTPEFIGMISEEYYVETADYNYVVKEIIMDTNDFFTVYCNANLEDFKGNILPTFDALDISVESCIKKIIDELQLPWAVVMYSSLKDKVEYKLKQVTVYECLQQVKEDYGLEYWFDTKNKKLRVYDAIGNDKGMCFMNELRLKSLSRQGQSYDFATVLYPIGKDGLTIEDVNNGKQYIENHDYSQKKITAYYENEDIEYAEDLKRKAEEYLAVISSPVVSYKVELSSLPPGINIGDNIILIDNIKKIRQKQRVVKIINYPDSPEKDTVELSNEVVDFAKTFVKFNSEYRKTIKYVKQNLTELK